MDNRDQRQANGLTFMPIHGYGRYFFFFLFFNRLSLRNNRLKFKTSGKVSSIYTGIYGINNQMEPYVPR